MGAKISPQITLIDSVEENFSQDSRKENIPIERDEEKKAKGTFVVQVAILVCSLIFLKKGQDLQAIYTLIMGLLGGIVFSLSVWTKIHPSKLFMRLILVTAIAALVSVIGVAILS